MAEIINQHKRMAMGDKVTGMKRGGMVGGGVPNFMPTGAGAPNVMPVGAGAMVPAPRGLPMSPMTVARRNNGIPGMKSGGHVAMPSTMACSAPSSGAMGKAMRKGGKVR